MSESNCSYPMQTLCSITSFDNFSNLFSYLHHWLPTYNHHFLCTAHQYYPSFNHPHCNLKPITFLTIPPHNASKYCPFCFTFGTADSARSQLFPLLVRYLIHSETKPNNLIINVVFKYLRQFLAQASLLLQFQYAATLSRRKGPDLYMQSRTF